MKNKTKNSISQPKILQLGQCLPKACSTDDIKAMLSADPAATVLHQMQKDNIFYLDGAQQNLVNSSIKSNELNIFALRKVPGSYNLWTDRRFYIFGWVFFSGGFLLGWLHFDREFIGYLFAVFMVKSGVCGEQFFRAKFKKSAEL